MKTNIALLVWRLNVAWLCLSMISCVVILRLSGLDEAPAVESSIR